MSPSTGVSDLLALATIRRILLELGYVVQPDPHGTLVGPLELWMHEPRPQLNGQSPLQALAGADGEARVRGCLLDLTTRPVRPVVRSMTAVFERSVLPAAPAAPTLDFPRWGNESADD